MESFVALASSYVQGDTMTKLCSEPGCETFRDVRTRMAAMATRHDQQELAQCTVAVADLPPGGWAMIIDSSRQILEENLLLDTFFLNGDNGFPMGVQMMRRLPMNPHLSSPRCLIRGPVIVFFGKYVDLVGMDYEAVLDLTSAIIDDSDVMQQIISRVISGVAQRYRDAGVGSPY